MHDNISSFEPLGTVANRIIASVAHRRGNHDAPAQTAIEQAETAVSAAIIALRAVLDALQASPPAKAVRGRKAGGA